MAKSKSHKEDEDLKGIIREKDRIIKALQKHVRKLEKEKHMWERTKDDDDEYYVVEKEEVNHKITCPKCKTGSIVASDMGIKILKTCSDLCGWRKTENK